MFEIWRRPKPFYEQPGETGGHHAETPEDIEFKKQFDRTTRINVRSHDDLDGLIKEECAEIVHVIPPSPKDIPILLAPGYLSPAQEYRMAIHELYNKDVEVISLNYPKKRSFLDLSNEQVSLIDQYFNPKKEDEIRKAITLLKVLEHEHVDTVNVIAHSAGAVDAAIAALLHPGKIGNIIFFCPAGLVDKNHRRLLSGLRKHIGDTLSESEWITEAKRRPINALAEGLGLIDIDIHKLIRALHERGVGLFIVSGANDPVFPIDAIMNFLKREIEEGLVGISTFNGGHGNIEQYMSEAIKIFGQLNQEKNLKIAS